MMDSKEFPLMGCKDKTSEEEVNGPGKKLTDFKSSNFFNLEIYFLGLRVVVD
jgi:hypothetical protein